MILIIYLSIIVLILISGVFASVVLGIDDKPIYKYVITYFVCSILLFIIQ